MASSHLHGSKMQLLGLSGPDEEDMPTSMPEEGGLSWKNVRRFVEDPDEGETGLSEWVVGWI